MSIVHTLSKHVSRKRLQRFEGVLRSRIFDTTLCLENLTDEGNVAAITRTAEALGLHEIHVVTAWAGPNPERPFRAVSKRAEGWLTVHHHNSLRDCLTALRQKQYWIAATHLGPGAVDMRKAIQHSLLARPDRLVEEDTHGGNLHGNSASEPAVRTRPRVALCVGNESRGCSTALVSRADCSFYIPQPGMMQSMNVSVATALALHAFLHRTSDYAGIALQGHEQRVLLGDDSEDGAQSPLSTPASRLQAQLRARAAATETSMITSAGGKEDSVSSRRREGMQNESYINSTGVGLRSDASVPLRTEARARTGSLTPTSAQPSSVDVATERLPDVQHWDTLARWMVRQVPHAGAILSRAGIRPVDL